MARRSCRGLCGPAGRAPRPGRSRPLRPAPSLCLRPPPSPGRQVRAPSPWGRALDRRLVAKRLQTLGAAREPFRGLYPVGARRGREISQGRVVEGSQSRCSHPRRAALCAQACHGLPPARLPAGNARRPCARPWIVITRGEGAAGEGARMRCGGGSHGGPRRRAAGRGGEGGKASGQITAQLGLQTHPWGEAQSSLAGPTAECLCFLRPVYSTTPQFLGTEPQTRIQVVSQAWTLLCTWRGGGEGAQ